MTMIDNDCSIVVSYYQTTNKLVYNMFSLENSWSWDVPSTVCTNLFIVM